MATVATAAGEEIRPSNTKGSRLFKHCQGSYISMKNEQKKPTLSQCYYISPSQSLALWRVQTKKEDRGESWEQVRRLTYSKTVQQAFE